jgi:DNA-binding NarL/FixJ family response regulator
VAISRPGFSRTVIAGPGLATWTGIKIALEASGIEVCGWADTAQTLVEEVARTNPDSCLIDVSLGGGLQAASELSTRAPRTAVILLTGNPEEEECIQAIQAGAVGYVSTSISTERLPEVVRSVLAGELAIPRAFMAVLVDRLRDRSNRRHLMLRHHRGAELTAREWEVLALMQDGLGTQSIAEQLLISDVTVRRHIGAALKKLRVQSREEALALLESA